MTFSRINPEALGAPKGFSHGTLGPPGGRVLFVAGQIASGPDGRVEVSGFVEQFGLALSNVLTVVEEAGGEASNIGRMTIFVTDLDSYRSSLGRLGQVYREWMGSHYPAMALVEVKGLVDEGALVEIQATAVVNS